MGTAKSVIQNIQGTEMFAIIGLLIFLAFFTIVLIRVIRMKKTVVGEYSRIPLVDEMGADLTEGETQSSVIND